MYLLKKLAIFSAFLSIEGYHRNCDVSQTLFVPKGNAAILYANNLRTVYARLVKTEGNTRYVIYASWHASKNFTNDNGYFYDKRMQNRTEITVINSTNGFASLEIKISDLQLNDKGTYEVVSGFERFCWVLLVLDLQQIPLGQIREDQGVRIYGQPAASLMKRPVINATLVWLLDGKLLNETEYFVIQDGAIWTAKIPRALNSKNITYRAIQDIGTINEMNLTLHVSYCDVSQTLFVPKGNAAILYANNLSTVYARLVKTEGNTRYVIYASWHTSKNFTNDNGYFYDKRMQNRTEITVINSTNGFASLEIKISDLQLNDKGTYEVVSGFERFCWVLLVLDLQQIPLGQIREDQGVRIYGQPAASLMKRPVINATLVWLLDGKLLNETEYFVIQDGAIWTAKIPRALNSKNITYRAIQDIGTINEMNLTLHVSYDTGKEMTAIAVLVTMQVLTTLFLGIFAVIVCRHFKRILCKDCANALTISCQHTEDKPVVMRSEINSPREHVQNVRHGAYLEDYVDLNAGTEQNTSELENYSTI